MTRHLYLSPHFDDAILSCGGLIAQQVEAGETVMIVTICAAPPPDGELSDFAAFQHRRWLQRYPFDDPIVVRRREDEAACAVLGSELMYLNELDCIYRRNEAGDWLYACEEALWADLHPDDDHAALETNLDELIALLQPAAVYAPLAVGNHVDHQRLRVIAEGWVQQGRRILFYEDYPYVESTSALWAALNRPVSAQWRRLLQPLSQGHARAKINAVACYDSQLDVLFDGNMPARVWTQMQRTGAPGLAEALWMLA